MYETDLVTEHHTVLWYPGIMLCRHLVKQLSQNVRIRMWRCVSTGVLPEFTVNHGVLPEFTVNHDQSGVSIMLPGYSFEHLDRYGNVTLDRVSRMSEAIRMSVYAPQLTGLPLPQQPGYLKLLNQLYQDRLIFALTGNFHILPGFYDNQHLYNPIVCTERLINIGNTSYQHQNTVTSTKTGKMLHKSIFHAVFVDHQTRRPVPLPDYFMEHFKPLDEKVETERIGPQEEPLDAVVKHYTARWSDTDYYLHVNQASSVRICYDMLVEGCLEGSFSSLSGDLALYRVTNYTCYYANEASPNDDLTVYMWESGPMKLHAKLDRQGTAVFYGSFQFEKPAK